jgi:glycosyltransferase involved in cell wall biosynthesis
MTAGPSSFPFLSNEYCLAESSYTFVGSGPNSPLEPAGIAAASTNNPPSLLFMGRQWELHGGPSAVQAVELVRSRGIRCELKIAGCNPKLPRRDWVKVVGPVPRSDAANLLRSCEIYLRPSLQDAFPVALQEALLQGTPCIGTSIGNQPWMIGTGGLIVPPNDPAALADAICTILSDLPTFREQARTQGSLRKEYFDWDQTAERILSFMNLR